MVIFKGITQEALINFTLDSLAMENRNVSYSIFSASLFIPLIAAGVPLIVVGRGNHRTLRNPVLRHYALNFPPIFLGIVSEWRNLMKTRAKKIEIKKSSPRGNRAHRPSRL